LSNLHVLTRHKYSIAQTIITALQRIYKALDHNWHCNFHKNCPFTPINGENQVLLRENSVFLKKVFTLGAGPLKRKTPKAQNPSTFQKYHIYGKSGPLVHYIKSSKNKSNPK